MSGIKSRTEEIIASVKRITEVKTLDSPIVYASATEIGESNVASVGRIGKVLFEMSQCKIIDGHHSLTVVHLPTFVVSQLVFLDFDVIFLGKPSKCLHICELFMLHQEADYTTAFAATEAFAKTF